MHFSKQYGNDRYRTDPLSAYKRPSLAEVPAVNGLEVEETSTGFFGQVVRVEKSGGMHIVVIVDYDGFERAFPLGYGFMLNEHPVRLIAPTPSQAKAHLADANSNLTNQKRTFRNSNLTLSASGSIVLPEDLHRRAAPARESRIWVEGKHDADLVQKIWGDDLARIRVVVVLLDGVDHLLDELEAFSPTPQRRAGVLVDHLITNSKEWHITQSLQSRPYAQHVLVTGHPYVDIWNAIKPACLGLRAWPAIQKGQDFKQTTLEKLGIPHQNAAEIGRSWQIILNRVNSYKDIESALLGPVEQIIDFVTA